jgi:hypothetical protein
LIWLAALASFADAAGGTSAGLLHDARSSPAAAIANLKEFEVSMVISFF